MWREKNDEFQFSLDLSLRSIGQRRQVEPQGTRADNTFWMFCFRHSLAVRGEGKSSRRAQIITYWTWIVPRLNEMKLLNCNEKQNQKQHFSIITIKCVMLTVLKPKRIIRVQTPFGDAHSTLSLCLLLFRFCTRSHLAQSLLTTYNW